MPGRGGRLAEKNTVAHTPRPLSATDRPLKSQIRLTIVLIIVTSLLATIATYAAGIAIFGYLLARIPDIEARIREEGGALLDPDARKRLERIIPLEGMDYQVHDAAGNRLYGSSDAAYIESPEELIRRLNTTFTAKGKFVRAVPVPGGRDGAVRRRAGQKLIPP